GLKLSFASASGLYLERRHTSLTRKRRTDIADSRQQREDRLFVSELVHAVEQRIAERGVAAADARTDLDAAEQHVRRNLRVQWDIIAAGVLDDLPLVVLALLSGERLVERDHELIAAVVFLVLEAVEFLRGRFRNAGAAKAGEHLVGELITCLDASPGEHHRL